MEDLARSILGEMNKDGMVLIQDCSEGRWFAACKMDRLPVDAQVRLALGSKTIWSFDEYSYTDWLLDGDWMCEGRSENADCKLMKKIASEFSSSAAWKAKYKHVLQLLSEDWEKVDDWEEFEFCDPFGEYEHYPSVLLDDWNKSVNDEWNEFTTTLTFTEDPPVGHFYVYSICFSSPRD